MLCPLCQSIKYDSLAGGGPKQGYPHHDSLAALLSCKDCDFCSAIAKTLTASEYFEYYRDNPKTKDNQIYLRVFPSNTAIQGEEESDMSNLLVYSSPESEDLSDQITLLRCGLFLDKIAEEWETGKVGPDRVEGSLVTGRPVNTFSNSDDCFRLANLWLKQCLEGHDGRESFLERSALRSFMPSRTIDVGPPDGSRDPRLVVHKLSDSRSWQPYVTLSHCWGGSIPLKTTSDTIEEWKTAIPQIMLPPTFRDAVQITRKLGMRHLWIDSLCIIQDSKEDWAAEAARMGHIYKYCAVNIAADTAAACHDGIFQKREESFTPVRLPLQSQRMQIKSHFYVRSGWWDSVHTSIGSESTLTSRGWVLQESFLSPRTLHYSGQQLIWECPHYTFAEGNLAPLVDHTRLSKLALRQWISNKMILPAGMIDQHLTDVTPETDVEKRGDLYQGWLRIIENYSNRKLTFHTDVFVALSGIATIFQAHLGDRYLAGLFEGNLLAGILWRSVSPDTALRSPDSISPSWSWASIVGGVKVEVGLNTNMNVPKLVGSLTANIHLAETYLEEKMHQKSKGSLPPDHVGAISGGLILLEGHVLEATTWDDLCYSKEHPGNCPAAYEFESTRAREYSHRSTTVLDLAGDKNLPIDSLAILHIAVWEWEFKIPNRCSRMDRSFYGLLLRATDEAKTSYQRVGIALMECRFDEAGQEFTFQNGDEDFLRSRWKRKVVKII